MLKKKPILDVLEADGNLWPMSLTSQYAYLCLNICSACGWSFRPGASKNSRSCKKWNDLYSRSNYHSLLHLGCYCHDMKRCWVVSLCLSGEFLHWHLFLTSYNSDAGDIGDIGDIAKSWISTQNKSLCGRARMFLPANVTVCLIMLLSGVCTVNSKRKMSHLKRKLIRQKKCLFFFILLFTTRPASFGTE